MPYFVIPKCHLAPSPLSLELVTLKLLDGSQVQTLSKIKTHFQDKSDPLIVFFCHRSKKQERSALEIWAQGPFKGSDNKWPDCRLSHMQREGVCLPPVTPLGWTIRKRLNNGATDITYG